MDDTSLKGYQNKRKQSMCVRDYMPLCGLPRLYIYIYYLALYGKSLPSHALFIYLFWARLEIKLEA